MTPASDGVPTGWTVAPLAADDCDELGRVHMAVWRDAYAGLMPADYLARLSDERCADTWRVHAQRPADAPERTLVVRDSGGRITGFASAGPSRDDDAPTEWELYAVNLAPAARGTGVADRLVDELVGERDATLWSSRATLAPAPSTRAAVSSTRVGGRCTTKPARRRSG